MAHFNSGPSDVQLRLQLHGTIYRPDSFVLMLPYCVNLKAIRYKSTSFNRIVADESHRVVVALGWTHFKKEKSCRNFPISFVRST